MLVVLNMGSIAITIPSDGDWIDSYDLYGGQGIEIDFDSYQDKLKELGFR